MHWTSKQRDKQDWCSHLLPHYKIRKDMIMWTKTKLHITVYRKRLQDTDNHYASLKNLIDALKDMGFIKDDNLKYLDLISGQIKSKKEYTEVIFE